jgi:eukaryotic-like serine/threonine-protein kinase
LAAIALAMGAVALNVRNRVVEDKQATAAAGLVQQLLKVDTAQVPGVVQAIGDYRRWIDPELRRAVAAASADPRVKLHASLALLPVDPTQVPYLETRLLDALPGELFVLRDALQPHRLDLTPKLWTALESAGAGDARLLTSAGALALYDPEGPRWAGLSSKVAGALVTVNSLVLGPWLEALRPVRGKLTAPLAAIFRDQGRSETARSLATDILAVYASDEPGVLAELLMVADPKAYGTLFPVAERQAAKAVPVFQAELARRPLTGDSKPGSEQRQDELAERQARAAIALVRLGHADEVWPLLRHSADPRLRSFIVNWLNPLGADPKAVVAELDTLGGRSPGEGSSVLAAAMDAILFHPETSTRRALILALGTYGTNGLSPGEQEPLIAKLLDLYENDPDAGIHGAAEWTLRQWKQPAKVDEIDAKLRGKDKGDRRWYVNRQGQTLVLTQGPVEFRMGSPPNEPDGLSSETPDHKRLIPRQFAIASKEVTVAQYQEFLRQNPKIARFEIDRYSAEPTGPMNGMTWYEAAALCNWLSRQEKLPECYEPNPSGEYAAGMRIKADALKLNGYRLPTEAEWEYACRAGAETSRYYGLSTKLLEKYARYQSNSQDHPWPGGSLLPNDLGLFDMLGNVYEWCQELYENYPRGRTEAVADEMHTSILIDISTPHLLRGGSFLLHSAYVRSALRYWNAPSTRIFNYGFRLARTHP